MFDKVKYALSLFDGNEIVVCLVLVIVYHVVLLALMSFSVRAALALRLRTLEAERDEFKHHWENRDAAWKDREEELRRILVGEKERELAQLKAEYDSYVNLLEQKLMRSRTRQQEAS